MKFEDAMTLAKQSEGTATPLPLYRCHKEVWALKIKEVIWAPLPTIEGNDIGGFIVPEEHGYAPIAVSLDWRQKHNPAAGGYLVFYKDGYRSYSPPMAFEEGYSKA